MTDVKWSFKVQGGDIRMRILRNGVPTTDMLITANELEKHALDALKACAQARMVPEGGKQ